MTIRTLALALCLSASITGCGKKEEPAPPPPNQPAQKSTVDSLISSPAPAPPPPTAQVQADATPAAEAPQGNWFSRKTPAEKQEIMEGWLYQFHQSKDPKAKSAVMEQIELSKLSATDKAQLETIRARLKYPPIPVK